MFLSHFLEMWFRARSVFLQLSSTDVETLQPTNQPKTNKKRCLLPLSPSSPPPKI